MEPYFRNSSIGNNPKIIAVESVDAVTPPGVPTRFNILKNINLRISEKVMSKISISQEDKDSLDSNSVVLSIFKSNFKMKNLFIITQYDIQNSLNHLFQAYDMGFQWFVIENSHFINEGFLLSSNNYINIDIRNTLFDIHKSKGGFFIDMSCLYPTILPKTILIFDTVKFFLSQERPPYIETENPPLVVMNPQNFSLNNVEYEYYGNFDFSGISFLLRDFKA